MSDRRHSSGTYRYVPGIEPYSGGVLAEPGYRIERLQFSEQLPWQDGFGVLRRYLDEQGLAPSALCGVELRCPQPHSFEGFIGFNHEYRALLRSWGLLEGDDNPVARTNVAPLHGPPDATVLYACSVVVPGPAPRPDFVIAGAGDLVDQSDLRPEAIVGGVAADGTSDAAPRWSERVNSVLDEMEARMTALGRAWTDVTAIDVYCAETGWTSALASLTQRCGAGVGRGLTWHLAHPPIDGLRFEMDVRGVATERVI